MLSSQEIKEIGDLIADLLETSMIEVSDIIGDFSDNLSDAEGPQEVVRKAKLIHEAVAKYGAKDLVEMVVRDFAGKQRIVGVLAYMVDSLESWLPEEEIEEKEEDLF